MNRRLLLSTIAAGAAAFAAPGGREEAVMQAERDWATGIVKRDFALLEKVLGDDLVYTHSNGRRETKAEYIASIKTGKQKYNLVKHGPMQVKLYGDVAVVATEAAVNTESNGQKNDMTLVLLHVYNWRGGRWQLVAHQSARKAN